jgi:hypothetical protein
MYSTLYLITLIFIYNTTKAAFIQPLSRSPIRPFSVNQGHITDYAFNVNIPSHIVAGGTIEVEFPANYQITSDCQAYISIDGSPYTIYPCSKTSPHNYMIQKGEIPSGEYTIVLPGIQNPSLQLSSSNFKIRTWVGGLVLVDTNEHLEGIPFMPPPSKLYSILVHL